MSSRIALSFSLAGLLGGCTIYGTELTSLPAVRPESAQVYDCPKIPKLSSFPPSGATLCFSMRGVQMEVAAQNGETVAFAIGPLFPVLPFFPERSGAGPLRIEIGFKADRSYSFDPWEAALQTDQGESVGISKVSANLRDGGPDRTVEIDRRERGGRMVEASTWGRFLLTFEKPIAPEQAFSLTLLLRSRDGADVQLPTISFKEGKVSYLGVIP